MAEDVATTCCGPINSVHACYPAVGWHLAFDGRMLHGAPTDLAATSATQASGHKRARGGSLSRAGGSSSEEKVPPPRRITLLVNVWLNWIPGGADPLQEEVVRKLSTEHVAPSWAHPCAPSERRVRKTDASGVHEWAFTGFGKYEANEGKLQLTLPATGLWRSREPVGASGSGGQLVALSWAGQQMGQLRHQQDKAPPPGT